MAYLNLLAATPQDQVDALRSDASVLLRPSLLVGVSHLLGYWIQVQPLGQLLAMAIDDGALINDELWHPLRPPVYQLPEMVHLLHEQMVIEWAVASTDHALHVDRDWLASEMKRLLRVYRRAAEWGECVVSVLQSPADEERAKHVRNVFAPK